MEVYFLAGVLALAIGGGMIYSFLNYVDKEDGYNKNDHDKGYIFNQSYSPCFDKLHAKFTTLKQYYGS